MRDDKAKLEKILESIDRIKEYTKEGKEDFFANAMKQDAVLRNYQVIGEAVKDLSDDLKQRYPDADWRDAAKFRDKVIHDYLDIDYEIVWNAVEKTLEPFGDKVHDIHQRLIYKVPGDREKPSKLEQKLKEDGNTRPKVEDVFQVKWPKERDRHDDLTR